MRERRFFSYFYPLLPVFLLNVLLPSIVHAEPCPAPGAPEALQGIKDSAAALNFMVGANVIDWDSPAGGGSNYGHDIGKNGWTQNHIPGYDYEARFRPEVWKKIFSDLKAGGATVVRIPLMTEGQGILWNSKDEITGLDPGFVKNVKFLLDQASAHGLKLELNLLTGNTAKQQFFGFYYAKRKILTETKTRNEYLERILIPFLREFGNHKSVWALDVLGEGDGAIAQDWLHVWPRDIREFVELSAKISKKNAPHIKVTASFGYNNTKTPEGVTLILRGTGLDFYEIHNYSADGKIPRCNDSSWFQWKHLDKPILLGEFGIDGPVWDDPTGEKTTQKIRNVTANYLKNAKACGFMGAFFWAANLGAEPHNPLRIHNLYGSDNQIRAPVAEAIRSFALPSAQNFDL